VIGRVGAVDYGRRRIGLAVSDPLGITVTGLPTVVREGSLEDAAAAVAKVLAEREVVRVIVGLPLHADGRESEMSAEARRFGEALGRALGREVLFVDETLTSWEAEESLRAAGRRLERARKEGEVDRRAAAALLAGWLREREGRGSPPPVDPPHGAEDSR
jgi:putative Holliday junction resolvase